MSEYLEFGIDLGTTNSCIARIEGSETRVLPNNDQMNVTPSAVRILRSGNILVGRRALNAVVSDPENIAAEFKRLMGQDYQKEFPASGLSLSPEELSAEVLKAMLADARRLTGKDVRGAVITVPAAFTALQCEATSEAARLAGLEDFSLLQEPIAAALAYGAGAGKQGKQWLIFDLGGGTLDVAVVSSGGRNLRVLEHYGDNHLGGKDIDQILVNKVLLPHLAEDYELPGAGDEGVEFTSLFRKLAALAEFAKIQLSTAETVDLSIFDIGEDRQGEPIESELNLSRSTLEELSAPLYQRSLALVRKAVKKARIKLADIDRVLLVGGPTQAAGLRKILGAELGIEIDSSLDPMTVVASGAAFHAAVCEVSSPAGEAVPHAAGDPGGAEEIPVKLAFDPATDSSATVIAGKVADPRVSEISLGSSDGIWTSGWIKLPPDRIFEVEVPLQERRSNVFHLGLRDGTGRAMVPDKKEIVIRSGVMTISAPPLPHTISVEVIGREQQTALTPVFERMALLPVEKDFTFRAARTLRPSEPETELVIKLWEGEALSDPAANHWIGNMKIGSEDIRRPIPEGSEIQLHIKVDTSRLITVEAFVPHLNQHFSDRIYLPKEGHLDYRAKFETLFAELDGCEGRLGEMEDYLLFHASEVSDSESDFPEIVFSDTVIDETGKFISGDEPKNNSPQDEIDRLRRHIEDLQIEVMMNGEQARADDDLARKFVERVREVRGDVAALEARLKISGRTGDLNEMLRKAQNFEETVNEYGTPGQRDRFALLYGELKRSVARNDPRIAERQLNALRELRWVILTEQEWFWENHLDHYRYTQPLRNKEEMKTLVDRGVRAQDAGDFAGLKDAVKALWYLEHIESEDDSSDPASSRDLRPGLKE